MGTRDKRVSLMFCVESWYPCLKVVNSHIFEKKIVLSKVLGDLQPGCDQIRGALISGHSASSPLRGSVGCCGGKAIVFMTPRYTQSEIDWGDGTNLKKTSCMQYAPSEAECTCT